MNASAARELLAPGAAPAQAPLTRRTRKRNERRDRVYAAAVTLFMEQGFDETSMDEIALQSSVGRTTVFNHFPRKASFLEEWGLRRRQRAAAALGDADPTRRSLSELLGDYFSALAELNTETRVETKALMGQSLKNTNTLLGHMLGNDLAELIAASGTRLRPSADPSQVGHLLALGYYSSVVRWIHVEPAPFQLDSELLALVDTVLSGALAD